MRTLEDGRAPRTARVFMTGRSQAVRLPKEYRFRDREVSIRKDGDAVILEPIRKRQWPRGYWEKIEHRARALDIGDVEPVTGAFADLARDDV